MSGVVSESLGAGGEGDGRNAGMAIMRSPGAPGAGSRMPASPSGKREGPGVGSSSSSHCRLSKRASSSRSGVIMGLRSGSAASRSSMDRESSSKSSSSKGPEDKSETDEATFELVTRY